ncbi:hypothetical protein Geob_2785 [Geotalea daltonii FRC-32]|uniref:Uncharacterized protein n=1 Tax=Geotalea daltonii (strain DSM 22248 / JCM 15807 / FRC-32) TaxID=316067 RepID=B9M216_GEODF|nr:hypothetical protein Geob_2785 [Geotalea daltonii FRC-32]
MHNCCQEKLFQNETLSITCRDLSHRYFGDFHVVSLEIKCEMDILPRHFKNVSIPEEIKSAIGEKITILRKIQQMGVPSARVNQVKDEIIHNFKRNSLPYFTSSSFPAKAILSEIRKSRKSDHISAATIEFLCAK